LLTPVTSSGSGDFPIRPLIGGTVNLSALIIDADGTGANIDAAVRDQLRAYGLTPVKTVI
jgi:hypothetical protein